MDVGGRCKQVKSLRRADELSGGKKIALNEICNSKNKKEKISGRKVSSTSHLLQEVNFSV